MNMKKSLNVRELTRAALIAAIYCVVTILWPFSFGSIQVRISEALTLLPVLFPAAIPGVSVGCMLAGLLTGAPWFDWLFGSLTTLTAALLTRKYPQIPQAALVGGRVADASERRDHRRDRPFRLCGQPHAFPFAAYDALRRRG